MLFLVTVPGLPKRIQQNAETADEAIRKIVAHLPLRLRGAVTAGQCSAEECPDPLSQFRRNADAEL